MYITIDYNNVLQVLTVVLIVLYHLHVQLQTLLMRQSHLEIWQPTVAVVAVVAIA
jgi:uncharacterized protein HemY